MATHPVTPDSTAGPVPVACSLGFVGLAAQARRWERLTNQAMTEREETASGLRLRFRAEPGVEKELRRLADAENQCCSWATWTVRTEVVLEVRSAGEGIAVLHGMLGRA
jgi:hypothetical protein